MPSYFCTALGLLSLLLSGCGTAKTHPVQGTVVFEDGSPAVELAGYLVSFNSVDQVDVSANGVIEADGTFEVGTDADGDGAVPGRHLVAIAQPASDGDSIPPPSLIDLRYRDFEQSRLTVTVEPGTNTPTLTVERRKP